MIRSTCSKMLARAGLMVAALLLLQTGVEAATDSTLGAGDEIGGITIPEGVVVYPDIAYREGHERWVLDLAMPVDPGDATLPGIVFVHGGGWRNGDKRKASFLQPALDFAARGYVCITTNYRLLEHAPFPASVEDVKCAVRWFRAHAEEYNLDPENIGAYGNSAGAHLVAMLGLCPPSAGLEGDGPWQEYSSAVQAVCCSATPSSFLVPMNNRSRPDNEDGEDRSRDIPEEMRKMISPMTYVSADAPPFLIIHDTSDQTVFVRHGDDLHQGLKDAGAEKVTYFRFDEGFGHGVFGRNSEVTEPARAAFFDRNLKPQAPQTRQRARRDGAKGGDSAESRSGGSRWGEQDTDGDGNISKDEAQGLMKQFFDRNDANSDGVLDPDELEALGQRLSQGRTRGGKGR